MLHSTPEEEFRLVAALCDRRKTANDGGSADFALLLAAALIVLTADSIAVERSKV
jgi:hypothetical protein